MNRKILDDLTPAGFEYARCEPVYDYGNGEVCRRVVFRPTPPPVKYEYVADAEPRIARCGDWVRDGWQWKLVKAEEHPYGGPQLCYRRVEVKK